jgi:hypothetical protein
MVVVFCPDSDKVGWGTDLTESKVDSRQLVIGRLTCGHSCPEIDPLDISIEVSIRKSDERCPRSEQIKSTRRLRIRHKSIRQHVRRMHLNKCRGNVSHDELLRFGPEMTPAFSG